MTEGRDGTVFGTTTLGGAYGLGVVFSYGSQGFKVVHDFTGGRDGGKPMGGLTLGPDDYLYGATSGNTYASAHIFKMSAAGDVYILYDFSGHLLSPLCLNWTGFYGVMLTLPRNENNAFFLNAGNEYHFVHNFTEDEGTPPSGLYNKGDGYLYGVTAKGGSYHNGSVFRIPSSDGSRAALTTLYSFRPVPARERFTMKRGTTQLGYLRKAATGVFLELPRKAASMATARFSRYQMMAASILCTRLLWNKALADGPLGGRLHLSRSLRRNQCRRLGS